MLLFVELDLNVCNLLLKVKYLNGKWCRMAVAIEYVRRRVVLKMYIMKKYVEVEYDIEYFIWDSGVFVRFDIIDEVVDG